MEYLKSFKGFLVNENLTEDSISKDPNTSSSEKEELRIKMNIKYYNEYKSKKTMFDNMFSDIENDIDTTTLNKLIGDNTFLRQYSQLLYKKRDSLAVKHSIENKQEQVKELESEVRELMTHTPQPDGVDVDSSKIREQVLEVRNSIKKLKDDIMELEKRLRDNDINNILPKWDSQMTKVIRDLKAGKPTLISILSHLK